MYPKPIDTLPERIGRYDMDLVQQQESPFPRSDPLHYLFCVMGPFSSDADHGVGGNDYPGWAGKLGSAFFDGECDGESLPSLC